MRRPAVALVYMPREIGLKDFILVEEDVLVQEEQRNSSAAISKTLACILLQKTQRGGAWGKEKIHSILVQIQITFLESGTEVVGLDTRVPSPYLSTDCQSGELVQLSLD